MGSIAHFDNGIEFYTYDIDLNDCWEIVKKMNESNALELCDSGMEVESRVLLESKGCRLPKNTEFWEGRIVLQSVLCSISVKSY